MTEFKLTEKEKEVLGHITYIVGLFDELDDLHPGDMEAFISYAREMQRLVLSRPAMRELTEEYNDLQTG